jgi:hypothetical protein
MQSQQPATNVGGLVQQGAQQGRGPAMTPQQLAFAAAAGGTPGTAAIDPTLAQQQWNQYWQYMLYWQQMQQQQQIQLAQLQAQQAAAQHLQAQQAVVVPPALFVQQQPQNMMQAGGTLGLMAPQQPQQAWAISGMPQPNEQGLYVLFVYHLPHNVSEDMLRSMFAKHGEVVEIVIMRDDMNDPKSRTKGYGFVKYRTYQEATSAVQYLNGAQLENKRLEVSFKLPKGQKRG